MKFDKKAKICDLITQVRKKAKYGIKDLNIYRLRWNQKTSNYGFKLVTASTYNNDMFAPKGPK